MKTTLEPEERAYSKLGSQLRRGTAFYPDGKIRSVRAGIPDTAFSIPAHGRIGKKYVAGWLTRDDGEWIFHMAPGRSSNSTNKYPPPKETTK